MTGWTGGQYSLFRGLLGLFMFGHFLSTPTYQEVFVSRLLQPVLANPDNIIQAGGLVLSVFLALGKRDQIASFLLIFMIPLGSEGSWLLPLLNPLSALLILEVVLPTSPYGSLDAVKRIDPIGNWHFRGEVHHGLWLYITAACLGNLVAHLGEGNSVGFELLLSLISLVGLYPRARVGSWLLLSMLLASGTWYYDVDAAWLVFLVAMFDPAWIRAKHSGETNWLFYDGNCGLCHRFMRFVLSEDRPTTTFRMAPLQGELIHTKLSETEISNLPDSVVLFTATGKTLTRSTAALEVLALLGGFWRVASWLFRIIPRPLRDLGYDALAAIRHRLFEKPKEACPVLPLPYRKRFDW